VKNLNPDTFKAKLYEKYGELFGHSYGHFLAWYEDPKIYWGNLSPKEMVEAGRYGSVAGTLESYITGESSPHS